MGGCFLIDCRANPGGLCAQVVCDWSIKEVMGEFLRAYYRRRERVGQLKNCAYYIIESELRAGDSLKFVTRGVWL